MGTDAEIHTAGIRFVAFDLRNAFGRESVIPGFLSAA
jgi:hypothetical protein